GNQRFGQSGFGFGYGNNQNEMLERKQYHTNQFGSNRQNSGSFQQGRQFQ
uniref:Uncharacterized protein n=1 Tax=Panagrolaimus sp. ES5 TaxID=591445 RepID=A0AC34GAG5_9BILA